MIIQCEQCRTKFKLDDSRVSERGVKVRCAKCRHVFTVRKPETDAPQAVVAAPEAAAPLAAPTAPTSWGDETVMMSAVAATAPEQQAVEPSVDFSFDDHAASPPPPPAEPVADNNEFSFGELEFGEPAADTAPPLAVADATVIMAPTAQPQTIDFGAVVAHQHEPEAAPEISFDFGEARAPVAPPQEISFDFTVKPTTVVAAEQSDFGGFDFGDVQAAPVTSGSAADGLDFGFDSAAPAAPAADFDLSGIDFGIAAAESSTNVPAASSTDFDLSGMDFGTAPVAAQTAAATSNADFDLSSMDFGSAAAAQQAPSHAAPDLSALNFGDEAAAAVTAQQPPAEASEPHFSFDEPLAAVPPVAPAAAALPDDVPPLPIASRRRQNSFLSLLLGLLALVVIGTLAYVGFLYTGDGSKGAKFFSKAVPADEGKLTVQNLNAYFISKSAAGELLVITGEAVNNFKKPRAALQLKGIVYGPGNEQLLTKNAYAGNLLTREQLTGMPAEKIEAAMNNQFGDSLANMEVQPGKTIGFTIVIVAPPANAKDYGVEAIGSTVAAAGK